MQRDEFALYRFNVELVEKQLTRIEQGANAILTAMGCPTDDVQIYAILAGEQDAPWPKRTAEQSKRRAKYAMYARLHIGKLRSMLGPVQPDTPKVADTALTLGWFASQLGLELKTTARTTKGGRKRGTQIAKRAATNDPAVKKHLGRWQISEELQDEYRSAASYVQEKTGLPRRTVERSMKRIQAAKSRQ